MGGRMRRKKTRLKERKRTKMKKGLPRGEMTTLASPV
jgi:hypothetical protein